MGIASFALVAIVFCLLAGDIGIWGQINGDNKGDFMGFPEGLEEDSDGNVEKNTHGIGIEEGRMKKKKNRIIHMMLAAKVMGLSIILPAIIALALFASWKGITISLIAFTVAAFAGIKSLSKKNEKSIQHVIVSKAPSQHQHWWRKLSSWEPEHDSHHFAEDHSPYRGYYEDS